MYQEMRITIPNSTKIEDTDFRSIVDVLTAAPSTHYSKHETPDGLNLDFPTLETPVNLASSLKGIFSEKRGFEVSLKLNPVENNEGHLVPQIVIEQLTQPS